MITETVATWDQIRILLTDNAAPDVVEAFIDTLEPNELVGAVFRLTSDDQRQLLGAVSPDKAAELTEYLPDAHAADLIDDMPANEAAAIIEEK